MQEMPLQTKCLKVHFDQICNGFVPFKIYSIEYAIIECIETSYQPELWIGSITHVYTDVSLFPWFYNSLLSDHFPGTVFVLLFDLFRCADGLCFCIRLSQQYHKIVWWYVKMSILWPVAPASTLLTVSTASKASIVSTLPHLASASTLSIFDDILHPGGNNLITVQLYDKVVKGKKSFYAKGRLKKTNFLRSGWQ